MTFHFLSGSHNVYIGDINSAPNVDGVDVFIGDRVIDPRAGEFIWDGIDWYAIPKGVQASAVVCHRMGLNAADTINYPTAWASNQGGYNNAKVGIVGATWAATDTDVVLTFRAWRRSYKDIAERGDTFEARALAKFNAVLTNLGTIAYTSNSLTDDGQSGFSTVKPADEYPSEYIVTAEPAATSSPAYFGWVSNGGTPPALGVQQGHLSGSAVGWTNGDTPDVLTETAYSIRVPNISAGFIFDDVGGADLGITLESVSGVGAGSFICDVDVVFY